MRRVRHKHKEEEIGFQIAPMIDVVFVIMLFFMVKAGDRQVETELKMKLPSTETNESADTPPMEENVSVDSDGIISHNEEPVTELQLKANFKRIAEQAKAEGGGEKNATPVIVTITANPLTPWEHVTTVMNAMNAAGIGNVSFSVSEEE